ncbi:inner membrane protein [Escherichia coli]|nr:inner membrane protein [Escherichia coli]
MLKHKIQTIFEALLYIMLTYWLIDAFFAFNKYDWMLESGDNICSIPSVSGEDRILQAMIAAFFSSYATYYSYLKKTLYAGNVRVLGICIFARYLSGLWLVAFLGTVYILLLVKSMRVVLTALIDREVTSLPSPQIHLVPHSQTQHSCHAIWRFAGQSIAQVHCR